MALVGDDCFFFLNSGCVRGSQCTFRHQPAARNTTIVCPQWLQRCCFKPNCVFRHTDDIVTRNQTPCYFEASSGVCWKPRCAFAHVRKPSLPVPLPPPPPVLPLRPPVLPAMPPVLPAMPPILPASVGISAVPPPAPLAANLPLPNNTPVVRAEAPVVVEKPVANVNTSALPQTVVAPPLTTPPPGLPSPSKLTEMLLGTKLPPAVKEAVPSPAEQHPRSTASAAPTPSVPVGVAPAAVPKPAPAAFPKSDHFNEQVRRFKEMLAAKSSQSQKKSKNDYSDDEKGGNPYKVKERQRNKKERREKEGYKSHKSSKTSKDKWSKADEEILYGDYKDVPLDKKHKKKKHKDYKEYADSEPEVVQVKSYEEILREKALRKLYSRRKEKFNEDFKELVDEKAARKEEIPGKTDRINDGLPDKVIRKNKRYNSDGDEVESSDDSEPDHEDYGRRYNKGDDFEKSKEVKKLDGNHIHIKDEDDVEFRSKSNDIHDAMLKKALMDSENRQRKRSKKHSKKRRHKSKRAEVDDEEVDLIEIHSNGESKKEDKKKAESSNKEVSKYSSEDDSDDSDSDSDSDSEEDKAPSKREEIIIPDETANIDFSVDLDDELAMEINQTEQTETSSKSKKLISSVVVPINASSSEKGKYNKKSVDRVNSDKSSHSRHHKSDSKSSDRGYSKQSESKRSNDRDQRRKSPNDSTTNKLGQTEHKKVVRLINTTEQPVAQERVSPTLSSTKDAIVTESKSAVKDIKVKSFDEIMAEKQKRNNKSTVNLLTESPDVVSIDSPVVAKTFNATLKEKSTRAKLEILNVPKEQNGNSTSVGVDKSVSKSKILTDEEKQKRKSIQLYKPPHPAKVENTSVKSTEVKMVVNTGPRKIIRIRKASLSTDLIDQNPVSENVEVGASVNDKNDKNDSRETVNVRSFEEIIREKRARQRREREIAQQLEKENSANETIVTTTSNNLIRRKPVIRRQVTTAMNTIAASTCSVSKTLTTVATILSSTTTTSNTDTHTHIHVNENKRTTHSDSNVAKVSPLNVVPPKRIKSDTSFAPVATQAESLENRDFFSRLRNTASRRTSTTSSHNLVKESERTQTKHRKRSVTTNVEAPPVSSNNHLSNENIKYTIDNSTLQSNASNETKLEYHGPSRKDIQEALDEKRRKREQDLLSDDEFEKEINELGSDDGDENFDDIDEDDLMMELEQMIDS